MINNITNDMVKDSPTFDIALKDFLDFAGDLSLVGHNIQLFDLKFLYRDAEKYFGKTIGNDYIDTVQLSRAYLPDVKSHALVDMADYYGIEVLDAHRALGDCRMTQKVFECLKEEIENPSDAAKAVKKCPHCGSVLRLRNGKLGEFYGCSSYPDCRYTRNI